MSAKSSKQFNTGIQWLLGSGILGLVGAGGWLIYTLAWNRPPEAVPVKLVAVERGAVESSLNESGVVELGNQQTLKSPGETAVDRVMVQPGDRVQAGQVLLTLRNPQRETALTSQQLKVQQKELELATTQDRIRDAQEELTIEEARLKSYLTLLTQGAIAQQGVQEQADRVRTSRNTLRDAKAAARTLTLEIKDLVLEQQRIQNEIQNTVITAPLSGVVLDVRVKNGDGVQFRTDLLTLGNPSQEVVKLQLSTLNANLVRVNQRVRISVIGPDPETFTGQVLSLYPQAVLPDPQAQPSGNRNPSDQATVPAIVKLDRPSRKLIPGGQVNVEIILDQRPDTIALDIEALQGSKTQPFVWLRDAEGKAQKRSIQTGLEGLLKVEVRDGLKPGDQVILPSPDTPLKPGTPVVPQSATKPAPSRSKSP